MAQKPVLQLVPNPDFIRRQDARLNRGRAKSTPDFISDDEMSSISGGPDFLSDEDMAKVEDTGVIAGLKRSASNLNPVNMVTGVMDNLVGPFTTQGQQRVNDEIEHAKATEAEDTKYQSEHPIHTIVETGLNMIPGFGDMAANLYRRATRGKDATGALTEAIATTVGGIAEGKIGGKVWEKAGKNDAYRQSRPLLSTQPEGHLRNSLNPDLDATGLKLGGDMLKAGEAKIGTAVKDIDTAAAAAKAQFEQELWPQRRAIIDPQKDVTVPGSRRKLIGAKIDAIPKDIRPGSPEYTRLVEYIKGSVPYDLTLGQLEEMGSSLNQQNRVFHSAKLGQALSKMESAQSAIDIGAEASTRDIMQTGMEKLGLGGVDALREVNKRIGSLIKMEDSIRTAERTARVEATTPSLKRGVQILKGSGATVNEGIAKAMMGWKPSSLDVNINLRQPTGTNRQLAASNVRQAGPSPDTSAATGENAVPAQGTRASRTGRLLGPGAEPLPPVGSVDTTGVAVPDDSSVKGVPGKYPTKGPQRQLPAYNGETEGSTPGRVFEQLPPDKSQFWLPDEVPPPLPKNAIFVGTVQPDPSVIGRLQVISETSKIAYDPVTGQKFYYTEPLPPAVNRAATPLRDERGRVKSTRLPEPPTRKSK